MPYVWIFLAELVLLAILTSHSSSYFLRLFYFLTGSEKAAVILFSILFFPGILIHELAHWLMAKLLFVPTSSMEFIPQIQGGSIKLGSVSIAKTDPLRRLLIGVAPVWLGLSILLGTLWCIQTYFQYFTFYPWWIWLGLGYMVFVIGSTMFSSRKDLEGSLGIVIGLGLIVALLYITGFDWLLWAFIRFISVEMNNFFQNISFLMTIPIGVNATFSILGWSVSRRL